MPVDFTAIDFETANSSSASACSVGLVRIRNSKVVETDSWLIKPPSGHDAFFEINTSIHGIRSEDVTGADSWVAQLPRLLDFIGDDTLVTHNAGFDLKVLRSATIAVGASIPQLKSLCSLKVARKVYELDSYRLPFAASAAGFGAFNHHEALADAAACAQIMCDSAKRTQSKSLDELATNLGLEIALSEAVLTTVA